MQNHLYLKGAPLRNRHRASHRQFRKSYPTFFLFSNTDPRPVTNICALKFWNHPFRTWQYYTINESVLGATHESNPFNSFVSAKTNLLPCTLFKVRVVSKTPLWSWKSDYLGTRVVPSTAPWVLPLSQICFSIQGLGLSLSLVICLYNNVKTLHSVAQW